MNSDPRPRRGLAGPGLRRSMPAMFAWAVSCLVPAAVVAAAPASEHAACVRLRDEKRAVEAAPHCRAAYDMLSTETTEAALQDRASIVFDAHHTYQEAFQASHDRAHLCAESALLTHFLAFLDQHGAAEIRQPDRRDARRLLDEVQAQLGEHPCAEELPEDRDPREDDAVLEDSLLPVSPVLKRPIPTSRAPDRLPAPSSALDARRPLRVAGGVTLGVGLVMGMATAGVLIYGEQLQRQRDALLQQGFAPGQVPDETLRASDRLLVEGRRANTIGTSVGAVAAASVISGITLLAVDGARHRRARRVALHPSAWPNLGLRAAVEF